MEKKYFYIFLLFLFSCLNQSISSSVLLNHIFLNTASEVALQGFKHQEIDHCPCTISFHITKKSNLKEKAYDQTKNSLNNFISHNLLENVHQSQDMELTIRNNINRYLNDNYFDTTPFILIIEMPSHMIVCERGNHNLFVINNGKKFKLFREKKDLEELIKPAICSAIACIYGNRGETSLIVTSANSEIAKKIENSSSPQEIYAFIEACTQQETSPFLLYYPIRKDLPWINDKEYRLAHPLKYKIASFFLSLGFKDKAQEIYNRNKKNYKNKVAVFYEELHEPNKDITRHRRLNNVY